MIVEFANPNPLSSRRFAISWAHVISMEEMAPGSVRLRLVDGTTVTSSHPFEELWREWREAVAPACAFIPHVEPVMPIPATWPEAIDTSAGREGST